MTGSRIPAALRTRLGDEATFGLIELFDTEEQDWSDHVLGAAADRFERRLSDEVSGLRVELTGALGAVRQELSGGLTAVRQEMTAGLTAVRQDVSATRIEMRRWSFVFWIGQVAAIAALLAFMLRGVR
jgi:hypothetical protein